MKIGGTIIARVTIQNGSCCISVPHPYLHGEAMIPIWKFMIAPAIQGECSNVVIHFLMELSDSEESERVSFGVWIEQDKTYIWWC